MTKEKESSKIKLILECFALVATIAGTVIGVWTAVREKPATVPVATNSESPPVTSTASSEPPVAIRSQQVVGRAGVQSASPAVVPASFTASPLDNAADDFERLCDQYAAIAYQSEAQIVDYNDGQLGVEVRVSINDAIAREFATALKKVLAAGEPMTSKAVLTESVRTQSISLAEIGSGPAKQLLERLADDTNTERFLALAESSSNGPHQAGTELAVTFWKLNESVAAKLDAAFEHFANATLQVDVQASDTTVAATRTVPLSFPERSTSWSTERYVTPIMPCGSEWSLQKHLLSPDPALKEAHRDSERTNRLVAIFPFMYSTETRPAERRAVKQLTPAVTYQVDVPIRDEIATTGLTVSSKVVLPGR